MPTTVHIPDPLLNSVDRRAKALGISRNRLVVRALDERPPSTPSATPRHSTCPVLLSQRLQASVSSFEQTP
jgi:hypothetical protein